MLASQDRIQELCREKGITVRKLEMKLGFSNGYIMTKREREFPTDRLSQIATELGVSVDYLMSGKEEPAAQEQNEKKPVTNGNGQLSSYEDLVLHANERERNIILLFSPVSFLIDSSRAASLSSMPCFSHGIGSSCVFMS